MSHVSRGSFDYLYADWNNKASGFLGYESAAEPG